MDKPKIQFLASILTESGLYPGMPVYERKSLLQRLAKVIQLFFLLKTVMPMKRQIWGMNRAGRGYSNLRGSN